MHGSAKSTGHGEGSSARSTKLQKNPKQGYRKLGVASGSGAKSAGTGSGGKTLSMENIQSLNAAYATSGPMYLSDRDALASSGGYPKGTMTLGRATSRTSYTGRATAMGSSPNITTTSDGQDYGDQSHTQHLQTGGPSGLLRQAGRGGGGGGEDIQAQLRELQRENELLRREMDRGRDGRVGRDGREGRMSSSVNSGKHFWSPEVKSRDRGMRKEEGALTSILKEQKWASPEEDQHLQLSVHGLQEELRSHREMNSRLQQENSGSHTNISTHTGSNRDLHIEDHRAGISPGHSPGLGPSHLHSPGQRHSLGPGLGASPRHSPNNTYNPGSRNSPVHPHSPGYNSGPGPRHSPGYNSGPGPRHSPANTLILGPRNSPSHLIHSPGRCLSPPSSPCMVPGCDGFSSPPPLDLTEENFIRLQSDHERQGKELYLLRKTLEEMELRIDSQKQTLGARDQSIQRLLEMIQGGGRGQRGERSEIITMATAREEAESQLGRLEEQLDQREKENLHLREELHRRSQQDPTKTKALQTVIDMKTTPPFCFDPDVIWQDTKISSLERNIRDLEDEVQLMKTSGLLHPGDRLDELKHMEVYKSHSKFMKKQVDQQKQELNKKESEMQALQTKLDALTNQNSDCKQHIEVLKESLSAKEQRSTTLQTEVDALRVRLEEKESFLSKKTKQLQDLTEEKDTLAGEIRDMKDMLDVKERKVNILQKKIENLLEQLKDKDKQLAGLRDRVKGLQTDSSNTDTALTTLEEALSEKERVIERVIEQKEREDRARLEEVERMRKENQELKDRLSILTTHTPGSQSMEESTRKLLEVSDRIKLLEQEVTRYREESGKSQAEVERLMGILREQETERTNKEKKITELERQVKCPNILKQMVSGERRPDGLTDGHPHSISQLEEMMNALEKTRQELDTTKQRLSTTQHSLQERDGHLTNLRLERRKQLEEILEMKQQALLAAISEKDANIALLELSSSKRKKSQDEVMSLKREKDRLMHQLKQQTQSRMKLIADNYDEEHLHSHHPHHPHHPHPGVHPAHPALPAHTHHRSPTRGPPHANHRPPMDQDDEEGIWA
ncbi:ERC protein 2-like isoform X1 [Coregonus clupeaformis]|uniref:ERC protein 2-like isoform X1 n=1 Tax=Coregonus clupeaformis TaxID=59861 RepID=UPI001BE0317E|nr:ERC protein 2-like isoform X1 [Coregonus clupeaformis]